MFIHSSVYALLENPMLPVIMQLSAFSLDEVKATLSDAENVKAEYDALYSRACEILDPRPWYDRLDNENELHKLIHENTWIQLSKTYGKPFPVREWKKAISSQRKHNCQIEKALKEFENAQETKA